MRVIHIVHGRCNPNEHNGISRVVYYLNKYEKLAGIQSEIWAVVDKTNTHYSYPRDEFVTVECYPRVIPGVFKTYEIINALKAEKDTIDLVHFHMIWFYDKNVIAKELNALKIPYIITTHGTYSTQHAYTGKRLIAKSLYELDYLKKATAIHIITREEGTGLQKYGYSGPVVLAYNGVEADEIPSRYNHEFFAEKPYRSKIKLGWVGVLREDKNLMSLIKAVAMLSDEKRKQFVVVLVGPDYRGNAAKYLNYADELGCRDNFDWIGPLYNQEKYDAIYNFDAYIMASFSEGFSMAILDAMACGKPCLLTRGCSMTYFNYPPRDFFVMCEPYPYDIARGINELLNKKEQWSEMGQHAKQWVQSDFNWEKIVQTMKHNYEQVLKGKFDVE